LYFRSNLICFTFFSPFILCRLIILCDKQKITTNQLPTKTSILSVLQAKYKIPYRRYRNVRRSVADVTIRACVRTGWQNQTKIMAQSTNKMSSKNDVLSVYANSLSEEAKRRYSLKLLYSHGTCSLPDPYQLTENWSRNPDTWPDLTFGDIYLYLMDTPSLFTKESMKAYKSLDAYK
jgi:hypothetical protein